MRFSAKRIFPMFAVCIILVGSTMSYSAQADSDFELNAVLEAPESFEPIRTADPFPKGSTGEAPDEPASEENQGENDAKQAGAETPYPSQTKKPSQNQTIHKSQKTPQKAPKSTSKPKSTPKPTTKPRTVSRGESRSSYNGYSEGDSVRVRATHYCPCAKCNGASNAGITASGKSLELGMCALNWLPLGSIVEVRGKRYVVEDRGVGTGRIDIFVTSHSYAYELGVFYDDLTIIRVGR